MTRPLFRKAFRFLPLLALTTSLAAIRPSAAAADDHAAPPAAAKPGHGDRLAKMAEELNLTDAQKDQIRPILKDSMTQRKALQGDATLTEEQKKAKMKELRTATHDKIFAVLTPEQQTKFDAMKEGGRGGRKQDKADKPAT